MLIMRETTKQMGAKKQPWNMGEIWEKNSSRSTMKENR